MSVSYVYIIRSIDIIPFNMAEVVSESFQAVPRKVPRHLNFSFLFYFMGGKFNKHREMVTYI